ncbi:EamA family transporter [Synoicihabitans lomoniglobus]|uniref:EamA family transporter n=1 Tax=Synoicihabitans lomoniglobus TaxID=2909285 RepID=A0AAF0CQL7_9BACT|nr:EamA family transporter [Opitutaceae bacterium LMO-M01]WED66186.1 EamA family transporter [Opitutaceae bacterium LMO-M01]
MSVSVSSSPAAGLVAVSSPQPVGRLVAHTLTTALTPIIWGSTYLVTTELLPPDRPFTAACIRTLPAGILLLLWERARVPRSQWLRLLILSLLNIGLFQALLFTAAYRLPGGIAAMVGATMPLLVLGFAWILDRQRPGSVATGAAVTAIGGMALIFARPPSGLDPIGIAAAVTGTSCLALGTTLARRWQSNVPLLSFTGWQLVVGGAVLAPLALVMEPPLPALQTSHIAGYIYLSVFGALLGYPIWFRGIAKLSPGAVAALGQLSPLTAILLGWAVLDEGLAPREVIGASIVLGAVLLLQWAHRPRR